MSDVRIQRVEALPGYRLRLGLSDGRTVERDLSDLLPGPDAHPDNVFRPWLDPAYFAQVFLPDDTAWPTATWPNGVDLDPDVLHGDYEPASGEGPRVLAERRLKPAG